jgi:hypothetical protein
VYAFPVRDIFKESKSGLDLLLVLVVILFLSLKLVLSLRALFLTSLAVIYIAERRFICSGGRETCEEKIKPVLLLRRLLNC